VSIITEDIIPGHKKGVFLTHHRKAMIYKSKSPITVLQPVGMFHAERETVK